MGLVRMQFAAQLVDRLVAARRRERERWGSLECSRLTSLIGWLRHATKKARTWQRNGRDIGSEVHARGRYIGR